jgi:hypothetical protein
VATAASVPSWIISCNAPYACNDGASRRQIHWVPFHRACWWCTPRQEHQALVPKQQWCYLILVGSVEVEVLLPLCSAVHTMAAIKNDWTK